MHNHRQNARPGNDDKKNIQFTSPNHIGPARSAHHRYLPAESRPEPTTLSKIIARANELASTSNLFTQGWRAPDSAP